LLAPAIFLSQPYSIPPKCSRAFVGTSAAHRFLCDAGSSLIAVWANAGG